jgi:hypothetical protein
MRTTVRLPEELLARAKERAARDNTTVTELIAQGLRSVLGPSKPAPAPRVMPRVSSASGRELMATVKTSELLELLDEELPLVKRR